MYGVEVVGVADSQLQRTRSAIARAASPEGVGKNPDLVLWALDGCKGTMDPAFDAHVLPIKSWALATWQRWRPHAMLARASRTAGAKLDGCKCSPWMKVTGPAATVVASAAQLGWSFASPHEIETDMGRRLLFLSDSPAYIANEVKDAVRKWRLARIALNFSQMVPRSPDFITSDPGFGQDDSQHCMGQPVPKDAIDFADVFGALLNSRRDHKDCDI